jgi:uncharacterized protein YlzI (FlbEa/FlbD family)
MNLQKVSIALFAYLVMTISIANEANISRNNLLTLDLNLIEDADIYLKNGTKIILKDYIQNILEKKIILKDKNLTKEAMTIGGSHSGGG